MARKKKLTKSNISKKDLKLDVLKLKLKHRSSSKYTGPTFTRYKLKSRDKEEVIQIIADGNGYWSGDDLPNLNPNWVHYHISEKMKEKFIEMIDDDDPRIENVKAVDNYAIIKYSGLNRGYTVVTTEFYRPKKKKGE